MFSRFVLGSALLAPMLAEAQAARPTEVSLGKLQASYAEPFSLVTNVRELGSGSVLVADPIARMVVMLDPSLKNGKPLGREGAGPGEFRQPDAVWPMPGDSTLLVDLGNARLTMMSPSGAFARSISMVIGQFTPGEGPPPAIIPGGVDARGRFYFQPPRFDIRSDSQSVMRYDPATKKAETLAKTLAAKLSEQRSGSENAVQVRVLPVPLSASDGWAVAPNGDLVIARASDYHVDIYPTAGAVRHGRPVAVSPVRIGSPEKREWLLDQQRRGGVGVNVNDDNGKVDVSFSRYRQKDVGDGREYAWPANKPPFDPASLRVDPKGRTWILRHQAAGRAPLYDVFGADGNLVGSVRLPNDRSVVGFGAAGVYIVSIDDDGLFTLERYAFPL